jgi:hypothetical protein
MASKDSQISRYYEETFKEALKETKFSEKQLEQTLFEFGYDNFPSNGINGEGFDKLMNRIAEIDDSESKLEKVKKKNLSSKVLEAPVKIKKEKNKKSNTYLSVVGRDLGKVGKTVGRVVANPIIGFLTLPTQIRKSNDGWSAYTYLSGVLLNIFSLLYYPIELTGGSPKRAAIVAGIHLGANLLSGVYEYARHVKEKSKSPITL